MSWMIALPGSFGSSSPNARPATCSYAMSVGFEAAIGTTSSMTMRVTRASAHVANARMQAPAEMTTEFMVSLRC
jgi:hypothetical protein